MERKRICDYCGNVLAENDSGTMVDGKFLCSKCVEYETGECDHCGKRIMVDDAIVNDNIGLCEPCFNKYYTFCHFCANPTLNKDIIWYDDYFPLCKRCIDFLGDEIEDECYVIFSGSLGTYDRNLVMEITVYYDGADDNASKRLKDLSKEYEYINYVRTDKENSNRFKIVTYTLKVSESIYHPEVGGFFTRISELGYKADVTSLHLYV